MTKNPRSKRGVELDTSLTHGRLCSGRGEDGKPYMAALKSYSRSVTRGVYSCGAVVGDCLYLLTEPANNPDIMLCLPLCKRDGSGSAVTEVRHCHAGSGHKWKVILKDFLFGQTDCVDLFTA